MHPDPDDRPSSTDGAAGSTPGSSPWLTPGLTPALTPETGAAGHDALGEGLKTRPVRLLGRGGQGTVWLVEHQGRQEALKILSRAGVRETDLFREAIHTRKIDHPNIVDVHGTEVLQPNVARLFGIDADGECPALRMEFVEGWDLGRYVDEEGILSVERVLSVGAQVASALQATHEAGIVHHDLKPSNIILRTDETTPVLTDFGISAALRQRDGKLEAGRGGTPWFMAPELFAEGGRGTPATDIWSLGVTLYYLATRAFPFPFGEMEAADAVREPARSPCDVHWHVEPALWALLRRMLAQEGTTPFASMAEVARALELAAHTVDCPACGQAFRFEAVAGRCPNGDCQAPEIVKVKEGIQTQRDGGAAIAGCRFDEAKELFVRAAAAFEAGGDDAARARCESVLGALEGLAEEHQQVTGAVRDLIEQQRLVEATRRLAAARAHFSRSSDLKQMRQQVRDQLCQTYSKAESAVRESLRARSFRAARETLSRVDQYLGEDHTRRELERGLGQDLQGMQWLYREVEEKEQRFNNYSKRAREAILELDFSRALKVYSRLENEFPARENAQMITRLRRASDAVERTEQHTAEELEAATADARSACGLPKIAFRTGQEACEQLVEDFPPADYPAMERFQEQGSRYRQAAKAVRTWFEAEHARAQASLEDRRPAEALAVAQACQPLVAQSDLFELATQDAFSRTLRQAQAEASRIDRLYPDAQAALQARDYATACLLLTELQDLVGQDFRDTQELLASATAQREQVQALNDRVTRDFALIAEGKFRAESALETLACAEQLYTLAEDSLRRRIVPELAKATSELFDSQGGVIRESGWSAAQARTFLLQAPADVARAFPEERWKLLFDASPELRRSMLGLLARGVQGAEGSGDAEADLAAAAELVRILEQFHEWVGPCDPPPNAEHPAVQVAERAAGAVEQAGGGLLARLLPQAASLLEGLSGFAPAACEIELRRARERVEALGRKASRRDWWRRSKLTVAIVVPLALIAVGSIFLAAWLAQDKVDKDVAAFYEEQVAELIGEERGSERVALLQALTDGYANVGTASSTADELMGILSVIGVPEPETPEPGQGAPEEGDDESRLSAMDLVALWTRLKKAKPDDEWPIASVILAGGGFADTEGFPGNLGSLRGDLEKAANTQIDGLLEAATNKLDHDAGRAELVRDELVSQLVDLKEQLGGLEVSEGLGGRLEGSLTILQQLLLPGLAGSGPDGQDQEDAILFQHRYQRAQLVAELVQLVTDTVMNSNVSDSEVREVWSQLGTALEDYSDLRTAGLGVLTTKNVEDPVVVEVIKIVNDFLGS